MLDFIYGLDSKAEKVRVKYGFFRRGFKNEANRSTNEHFTETGGDSAYIKELDVINLVEKKADFYIYFQVLVFHEKVQIKLNV